MSSPLAIGAVSAVLRNLLDNAMIDAGNAAGTPVTVTAVAPDTIDLDDPHLGPRLNLFLTQVTPNAAWCNAALPTRSGAGERISNTPLAVDLHYLLTAYGQTDFQAEILLGYAMHVLHERPWLDRASIRKALSMSPLDAALLPTAFQSLLQSDLADQVEAIKVTQAAMGIDEMSKLWSAIQTHYRPTAAYQVSVVLIESTKPARTAMPVLSRGKVDLATQRDAGVLVHPDLLPATPTLFVADSPNPRKSARLGEKVSVTGIRLAGTGARAHLMHRLLTAPYEIDVTPNATGTGFELTLPNTVAAQTALPAGTWQLSLVLTPTGETDKRETNGIPLLISAAPVFTAIGAPLNLPKPNVVRQTNPAAVRVTLATRPRVRPEQTAILMLGAVQATANPRKVITDPLVFIFPGTLPAGNHPARLRVDGVDSELILVQPNKAPVYDPAQRVSVP